MAVPYSIISAAGTIFLQAGVYHPSPLRTAFWGLDLWLLDFFAIAIMEFMTALVALPFLTEAAKGRVSAARTERLDAIIPIVRGFALWAYPCYLEPLVCFPLGTILRYERCSDFIGLFWILCGNGPLCNGRHSVLWHGCLNPCPLYKHSRRHLTSHAHS